MTVKCIDISHWQGFPNMEQVADEGVLAVIHKCTEDTGYVDPNRRANCAAALDAGMAVATYHWLAPGNARDQMEHYLQTLQPVDGERVIIDYEEEGCTLTDLRDAVERLLDEDSLEIAVYSGHLLKQQLGDSSDDFLAENTSLWLAQYTTGEVSWPSGTYETWSLHQFTDQGELNGVDGSTVDFNRFNGDDDALLQWIGPAGKQPPPKPRPPRPPKPKLPGVLVIAPTGIRVLVKHLRGPDR